ncbi:MAG: hypothetical protein ACQGVK_11945 [Myxococcota bacterium]
MTKRITTLFTALAVALAGFAAAADAQQALWSRTKMKVKGEAYDEGTGDHIGTAGIGLTCYHRVTFAANDDETPEIRQYCEQDAGDWDADDWEPDYRPLPDGNILLEDEIDADKEDRETSYTGFFKLLVERKKNGKPKSVSLRQRNAIGSAVKDGTPVTEVFGGGIVKGNPVAVADLPDFLQQIANQRSKLMLCGSSSRDVTTFIPSGVELTYVEDCTPDSDTQALLVSRSGASTPSDVVLKAYVDQGGIVITEWSGTDEVFNKVFDAGVVQGPDILGDCLDNVMPEVQFGKKDAFWKTFEFVSEESSGCGYDLSAFPGIRKLGGWDDVEGSVSLAYRDYGDGRVWLVETDWQDPNPAFKQTSADMLGYMIMHRR